MHFDEDQDLVIAQSKIYHVQKFHPDFSSILADQVAVSDFSRFVEDFHARILQEILPLKNM